MNPLNLEDVCEYVNENIVDFHQRRIESLEGLSLHKLLKDYYPVFKKKRML